MLVRIVKMTFKPDEIEAFKVLFEANKDKIRNVEGCLFLELYQDLRNKSVFFTYSYWKNETNLENYRKSSLFQKIWSSTKVKFNAKPEAWSVQKLVSLK
ncbi:putative quinol monooxygenase [Psychroflexus salis]|uniref:Antibiotic biosynthesis monooxygenase n=1 Tax=Psychroflexus salis TaxID=1526574 RepID=A0A916ZVL0_9FLAO|nr:putative quinol monooxygenase [Psychroflexus salis]GGE14924.1 antibiotic biosynthesis monooxygenase [Psychroflexus salis]